MAYTSGDERHILSVVLFDSHGRPRSGWRFLVFMTLFVLAGVLVGALTTAILSISQLETSNYGLITRAGASILSLILALLVGWFCAAALEKLPFRSLGAAFTKYWLKDLSIGIVVGALSLGVAVLFAMALGGLRFEFNAAAAGSSILRTLAATFVLFFLGAAFEEAFVRGYMFQTFARSGLAWLAILLTSVIFAAGHLGNEGATAFSTANTALAGVWLGIAYLKTRTLWFVTGVHFAWNWVQGSFFGVEVSGFDSFAQAPLLKELDSGPVWITGGEYGLEGGFAATFAILVSIVLIRYLPFLKADDEMVRLTSPPETSSGAGASHRGPPGTS